MALTMDRVWTFYKIALPAISSAMHRWILVLAICTGLNGLSRAATNGEPVTMVVPGFTVRELPVKLSNINNLRFSPNGLLTALGYDGRIWLLKDTDGDGLEDSRQLTRERFS